MALPRLTRRGWTRGGLARRIVLASVVLAVLISGVFAVLLQANLAQREARSLARHAGAEVADADALLALVIDLETGQRGYVITRQERFLEPWNVAREAFPGQARALVNSAIDPLQKRRARLIEQHGTDYIRDYSVPLVNGVRHNQAAARSVAATDEGKRRIDALRVEFDRFKSTATAIAEADQTRSDSASKRALAVAAGGLGTSILLIALFGAYVGRAVVGPVRRAAAMAGRLAGGDLAVRMPQNGIGEIGELERSFNIMGISLEASRDELRELAGEQAALRRVATLVARAVSPSEVWGAVVAEVDQLLNPDASVLLRYEPDRTTTILAARSRLGLEIAVGTRAAHEGESLVARILHTSRAARLDTADRDPTSLPAAVREFGIRSEVGAPIIVEDRLWGVIVAAWMDVEAPRGTEARIAEFTELVATAIANADSRAKLTASRARVVATSDETRRRIERDLHDGAQQRLVHTIISLKLARQELGDSGCPGAELLDEALEHAELANAQLRELVHGIMPAVLRRGGLRAGVDALISRAPLLVSADVTADRLPPALEATAYFIVAEALTNVIKHAGAHSAQITASADANALRLEVRDDGVGGALVDGGSGLVGLEDRAAAVNGVLHVESPVGGGTVITATLPVPRS